MTTCLKFVGGQIDTWSSHPFDPSIIEKIIAAHLAGHGRNQIDRELREQGIKVSHSSISNFIRKYKREHEQPSQTEQPSISAGVNINKTSSPSSKAHPEDLEGDGLAIFTPAPTNGGRFHTFPMIIQIQRQLRLKKTLHFQILMRIR